MTLSWDVKAEQADVVDHARLVVDLPEIVMVG